MTSVRKRSSAVRSNMRVAAPVPPERCCLRRAAQLQRRVTAIKFMSIALLPDSAGVCTMGKLFRFDQLSPFEVRTWPAAEQLGHALEHNERIEGMQLRLEFGEQVARIAITDMWSACCELLLEAQLVREAKLDHFILDVEQIFDLAYDEDQLLCIFSQEHMFAVSREGFAAALEKVVERIFCGTSCPKLMRVAAGWGASAIRAQPYSARFSDSLLT